MNARRLTNGLSIFGLCLGLAAQALALEAQPDAENMVPVEQASFHQLVFVDDDVSILNNRYPPGGDSDWHWHERDMVYVVIQPSRSSIQNLGKPMEERPKPAVGAAGYGAMGGERRVHKVVNGPDDDYHILVVELRRPKPLGKAASSRDAVPQYTQIIDNPRVRAWRLILEPGQSVPSIAQNNKGVRVVVRGGLLTTRVPGVKDQQLALRPGDFAIQPAGTERALSNGGRETIELVELELK